MTDQFKEEVVTKRNQGAQTALYVLANVLMIASGFLDSQVTILQGPLRRAVCHRAPGR